MSQIFANLFSSNTLQAINQVLVIRTKIEANLMVGVVKYVRVQVESAANIYNDIRLAILRTAHTAVDPNIASDLMQKVKIYKSLLVFS